MSRIKINNALLEKENAKDLNFRRVLTTSPRQYQDRLAGAVIRYGGRPIWIPGIQINELRSETSREQRRAALDALDAVDYLVLPSKNAMFACLKAYDDSISTFQTKLNMEHRNVEVWAMGADADYLSGNLGIKNVKKPKVASTDGIIEAMRTAGSLEGNALVFVPEVVPPLTEPDVVPKFLGNLRDVGITPHRIPAYETVVGLSLQEVVAEVNMLIDGSISAIAFTSTAECEGLCYIIGKEKLLRCIRLHNIVIAAHGLTTAKGVAKVLDFEGQICVSKDSSTFEGMVAAIADCM